jgi:SAM-dependent methyltransferase
MVWFRLRSTETELMDRRDADRQRLIRTVAQFRHINVLLTRYRYLLSRYILRDLAGRVPRRVRVLDIGAGGADMALWLDGRIRRLGHQPETVCVDSDPRIVAYAKRRAGGRSSVRILHGTHRSLDHEPRFDYAFSNHLLHHLADSEIEEILSWLHRHVSRTYVMNDLLRSRISELAFGAASSLFFHGSFARNDGLISIRRGFRPRELGRRARAAGLRPLIRSQQQSALADARAIVARDGSSDFPQASDQVLVRTTLPGRVYLVGRPGAGVAEAPTTSEVPQ